MDQTDLRNRDMGERCNLHFAIENNVTQTKEKVNKLEERTEQSFTTLNTNLSTLTTTMNIFMTEQKFKDERSHEVKTLTNENKSDINDLRISLKSVEDTNKHVVDTLDRMDKTITVLSGDIKETNKIVVSKDGITDMMTNAIVADKNQGRDRWFDALPVKITALVSLVSFIAFFTIKIVLLLLGIPIG